MREVLVKSIYSVDTISKGNSKPWVILMDYMKTVPEDENVQFDFKGISVIAPWATNEFKQFMQDKRVWVKLWNNKDTVDSINMMNMLNGGDSNRATNEVIMAPKTLSFEEKQIINMSNELQGYFVVEDGQHKLMVHKRFDQLGASKTIKYIDKAIRDYCKKNDINEVVICTSNITIQTEAIKALVEAIENLDNDGINVSIESSNSDAMNKLGMYQNISKKEIISDKDKLKVIKTMLQPGKVGMLIRYKDSRAKDEFGRKGKGVPRSCRVSIFVKIKKEKDKIYVCFRTYNGNTFYTNVHWALEHDNTFLDNLDYTDLAIPLEQFGMYNDFLGSSYHFITPVQTRPEDSITMLGLDEQGKVTYTKMTIPERIKAVFNDWDIKYDTESLQSYTQKTKEILDGKGE